MTPARTVEQLLDGLDGLFMALSLGAIACLATIPFTGSVYAGFAGFIACSLLVHVCVFLGSGGVGWRIFVNSVIGALINNALISPLIVVVAAERES